MLRRGIKKVENLRLKILFFLLGVSCLPVLILLLAVIIYSEATGNSLGDYTAVILTSCALFAAGGTLSLVLTRYFIGKAGKVLKSLQDVFSLNEYNALRKGLGNNPINLIVNSFEYYREKRSENTDAERELTILRGIRSCSLNINFHKAKDARLFMFSLPYYWKKTYPYLDIPEKASLFDYIPEENASQVKTALLRAEETEGREFSVRSLFKVGEEWIHVLIAGKSVLTKDGEIILVGIISDESRRRKLESAAEEYRNMYHFALLSSQDLIYEVDVHSDRLTVMDINKWEKMFGEGIWSPQFSVSRVKYLELIDPDYREGFLDRFLNYDHLSLFPNGSIGYEYRIRNAGGEYIWVSHVVCAVGTDESNPSRSVVTRVIGRITDINEQTYRRIRESAQSQHDALTGALRKSVINDEYTRYISDDGTAAPAIVVFDINGFRLINDLYGHIIGDRVLQEVVNVLWENQNNFCKTARTGGDEFAMLVKTGPVQTIVQKILERFERPFDLDGTWVNVTVSVGTASRGSGGESFDEVYCSAVKAARDSSLEGTNKFSVYGG